MPVLANAASLITYTPTGELLTIPKGAVVWQGTTIVWLGAEVDIPPRYEHENQLDADGGIIIPGLIDCHTHLLFGGWRVGDYLQRIAGAHQYQDCHNSGGGINETVRLTAQSSDNDLVTRALGFLEQASRLGVTAMEVKSGYGLTIERERRILDLYRKIQKASPIPLSITFLAHMFPPDYAHDRSRYCEEVIDFIAEIAENKLATAVDVFVEQIAFTVAEAEAIGIAATRHGLRRTFHADQLRDFGGAHLAARLGASSADHLEHASAGGLAAMADAGVIGVILPFASWNLRQSPTAGGRLREHGVSIAVATDFNPGSAPSLHLPLAMAHAVIDSDITPAEAFKGVTQNAARVLQWDQTKGSLAPGMDADIVVLAAESLEQWLYHLQPNAARLVIAQGEVLW